MAEADADYRHFVHQLAELAQQTDRGIELAQVLVELLRQQRIIIPTVDVIERVCSDALISWHAPSLRSAHRAACLTACCRSVRARRAAADLATPTARFAEAQAWAGPLGASEDRPRSGAAGRSGTRHSPESEARPRADR